MARPTQRSWSLELAMSAIPNAARQIPLFPDRSSDSEKRVRKAWPSPVLEERHPDVA